MNDLLQEYVELYLEKIRSKSDYGEKKKFSFQEFKSITDFDDINQYASWRLELLGEGSARNVYAFSNKYVLKVAYNDKGIDQNFAELDAITNPKLKNLFAEIKDYDPNGIWLVSEMVRRVSNDEFENMTGINPDVYETLVFDYGKHKVATQYFNLLEPAAQRWFLDVYDLIKTGDMARGDLYQPKHWGKTPDGRLVLYDYGLTNSVYAKHYKE